jgi:hypothetical protein
VFNAYHEDDEKNDFFTKIIGYSIYFFIKSVMSTYQVFLIFEDEINKIKNKKAIKNIEPGEIWREYKNYYDSSYCDWIILNVSKEKITVSNIKDHFEFQIKNVEPRIIYDYWLKKTNKI